jgi:hypothetical protein
MKNIGMNKLGRKSGYWGHISSQIKKQMQKEADAKRAVQAEAG